jgi:hypothetical protein
VGFVLAKTSSLTFGYSSAILMMTPSLWRANKKFKLKAPVGAEVVIVTGKLNQCHDEFFSN